jgi:hypothetical protein
MKKINKGKKINKKENRKYLNLNFQEKFLKDQGFLK